ncbi:MAG: SPOR domain-containing protein [bacterium]
MRVPHADPKRLLLKKTPRFLHGRVDNVLIAALLLLCISGSPVGADDPATSEDFERQALRALTRRNFPEAIELFENAARASNSVERAQAFMLQSAELLIETGEHRAALERAIVLESAAENQLLRRDASLLGIRALYHLDRAEDAYERIRRLAPTDPTGMFLTAHMAREMRDPELSDIIERLLERFPDSLEGALASDSDWISLPALPSLLFSASRIQDVVETDASTDASPEPVPHEATQTSDTDAFGIQLGSFSSSENARRHAQRIRDEGWDVSVDDDTGETFRVLVRFEEALPRSEAELRQLELRDAGFEGFLLFGPIDSP